MIYTKTVFMPIGKITMASDGKHLVGLWLAGQRYFKLGIEDEVMEDNALAFFTMVIDWLERYFAKEQPSISEIPLLPNGSAFRQDVWNILCEIPYGTVTTYGEIAKRLASKRGIPCMSSQAVGGAIRHNPISIIIPCHRVIGGDGSLVGYAGGIPTKIKLLEHEGITLQQHIKKAKDK